MPETKIDEWTLRVVHGFLEKNYVSFSTHVAEVDALEDDAEGEARAGDYMVTIGKALALA